MSQENKSFNHDLYHRVSSSTDKKLCQTIHDYFYDAIENNAPVINKTHFFHGRYENIYIKPVTNLALKMIIDEAKIQASKVLKCDIEALSMDFWFNDMPPQHITDWHRHDVMDEELSGVFYISVPENSGDLLLKEQEKTHRITPLKNDFIFFNPNINHSVEENKSTKSRLSIGMNFGYLSNKD